MKTIFEEKKQEFISGVFSEVSVNEVLDTWADQISDATIEAKEKHGDAISVNQWTSEIQKLKDALDLMRK